MSDQPASEEARQPTPEGASFEEFPFEELPVAELGIEELESRLQLAGEEQNAISVNIIRVEW